VPSANVKIILRFGYNSISCQSSYGSKV
jgi:hypothetical protein